MNFSGNAKQRRIARRAWERRPIRLIWGGETDPRFDAVMALLKAKTVEYDKIFKVPDEINV